MAPEVGSGNEDSMTNPANELPPTAMSLLKAEISRFLKSAKAEVLCIRGRWGVGKTYTWEMFLGEVHTAEPLQQKYSYVSLFGLDTLDKFKTTIFENTVPIESIGSEPSLKTLDLNLRQAGTSLLKAFKPGLAAAADQVSFLAVRDLIVCIDDLERKGEKLRVVDVLGLASLLKERRNCKVVLILNEEELETKDQETFAKYSEKVIDSSLVFAPTPVDSAEIAIKGPAPHMRQLADCGIKLGIANIRILKRLERLVSMVEPTLRGYDDRLIQQAVTTLALFGWAVYGKQDELLDFALTKRYRSRFGMNGELGDAEKSFDDLLEKFGFGFADDFDKVLLDGIMSGFFDLPKLKACADTLQEKYKHDAAQQALDRPWQKYRDSFDDNGDEIAAELLQATKSHIAQVTVSYLDAVVSFLKRMGRDAEAKEAIDLFMKHNANEPRAAFDINNTVQRPSDPDVSLAISEKHSSYDDKRNPADVLFQIAKNSGWGEEDVALLSKLSPDDFYAMFKTLRGLELRSVVRQAMEFARRSLAAGDKDYRTIGTHALTALKRLGAESPLNAQRTEGLYNIREHERFLQKKD
ncbi:hypothetical protein ACVWWO_005604 [Bradyrhizobium sp. F1.13.1]